MAQSYLPHVGKLGFTSSGWNGAQRSQMPWVPAAMGVMAVPWVLVSHTETSLPALTGAVVRTEAEPHSRAVLKISGRGWPQGQCG